MKRITFGVPVPTPASSAPPVRTVRCTVLPELTPDAFTEVVTVEWFTAPPDGGDVVAEEHVVRGEQWLATRWRDGGDRFKHMAYARRAAGLTPGEFAERWRTHAGTAGGVPIPEEAKGAAYAQNHPLARAAGEWPFDAVNEVWFDGLDGLRRRIEWFEANHDPAGDELFGPSRFLAVRETVVD
jgi:hypothetical protein